MSTYAERRQETLTTAAAAAATWIAELEAELAAEPADPPVVEQQLAIIHQIAADLATEAELLAAAPATELTDEAAERAVLAWLWGPPQIGIDPIFSALGSDAPRRLVGAALPLPGMVAAALGTIGPRRPGSDLVPRLRTRFGDAIFETLVAHAVAARLALPDADRPVLVRDVAVLLPVRLETVFRQHGPQWTMLLRVVPDEASVCRDDPTPTPTEITLLTRMWQDGWTALTPAQRALAPSDWLSRDLVTTAWEQFCSQVSPARAAWLAGAYPPVFDGGTVTVAAPNAAEHPAPPNRVGGFPTGLEVWCSFGTDDPVLIGTSTVDTAALVFDVVGGRAEDDGTVVEQADRWWVSWQAAKDVGLGLEIVLPEGHGPTDIGVLYVVGISEENPAGHLRAQANAGELARLPLGVPTNAVDGAQAASLGHGAADWRDTAAARMASVPDALGHWLTGDVTAVPAVPASGAVEEIDAVLVRALWPALWGHHLRDVWGFGDEADRLGAWAGENLRPEGALPPIRIADQPYGLLPASVMRSWRIAVEEGDLAACEEGILPPMRALRDALAAAARQRGTAVGADIEGLLDLLGRDALSAGYAFRLFLPAQLWSALWNVTTGVEADQFADQVRATYAPVAEMLSQEPFRAYLAAAGADPMRMPLVVPTVWPEWYYDPGRIDDDGNPMPAMTPEEGIARLLETLVDERTGPYDQAIEAWRRTLPDSLLIRLLLYADMLAVAAVARVNSGTGDPMLEPVIGDTNVETLLHSLGQAWSPGDPDDHPAGMVLRLHREGLARIYQLFAEAPEGTVGQVERALRATMDTAMQRVDPWLAGMATRRLDFLAGKPDTRFRLGIYGWVDGPILGAPGPTAGGLLHAPSHEQALTAVILRDKAVTDKLTDPGGRELWSMQLDSNRIRLAEEMAEEVRIGAHLFEAVGRQVERIVGTRAGVAALRSQFPMRSGQEEAGRVCSGVDALTALLSPAPPIPLSATQVELLVGVRDALDAYGDLLVAEAVHQVVTGHADLAGAAMDAAAGLASPPTLAFTETPLAAEGLMSAVVTVVPFVPSATGEGAAPALIADASVAAAVIAVTGPASAWTWDTVTLSDLGLEPADTLGLSTELLASMAAFRLGGPPSGGTGPGFHTRVRELIGVLGSQPALASDLARADPHDDATAIADLDAAILADLQGRYAELRDEAQRTIDALVAAVDTAARIAALRRALRWGITPTVGQDEQESVFGALLDGTEPADAALLSRLVTHATESLRARLTAAPAPNAREPVGRAIAELAAPEGKLAVLAALPLAALRTVSGLGTDQDPTLDEDWLPVVAAVRPHLARLEALQLSALLSARPGLTPVSSAPGDHWRTAALADLRAARNAPGGNPRASLSRFVAAYTLGNVWAGDPDAVVAIGLVDSWSESVPRKRQTTTAAFGFNAPASRPPQAILLAVPPDLSTAYGAPATTAGLVEVLADTRLLAHARAGRVEELGGLLAALPTTLLQGTGNTGLRFDGTTF